jgi:hypothetical protein
MKKRNKQTLICVYAYCLSCFINKYIGNETPYLIKIIGFIYVDIYLLISSYIVIIKYISIIIKLHCTLTLYIIIIVIGLCMY